MTSPHDPFAPPSHYGAGRGAGQPGTSGPGAGSAGGVPTSGGLAGDGAGVGDGQVRGGWASGGTSYGSAPTPFQGSNNPYQGGPPALQGGQAWQGGQVYPNPPYPNQGYPNQAYPGPGYGPATAAPGQQFGTGYPAGPYAVTPNYRPGANQQTGANRSGNDAPGAILAAALMTWLGAAVGLVLGLFFVVRAGQVDPLAQWGLRHVSGGQIQAMGGLIAAVCALAAVFAIGALKRHRASAIGLLVLGGIWVIYGIYALVVGSFFYAATALWVLVACALLLVKMRWYVDDEEFAPEKVLSHF